MLFFNQSIRTRNFVKSSIINLVQSVSYKISPGHNPFVSGHWPSCRSIFPQPQVRATRTNDLVVRILMSSREYLSLDLFFLSMCNHNGIEGNLEDAIISMQMQHSDRSTVRYEAVDTKEIVGIYTLSYNVTIIICPSVRPSSTSLNSFSNFDS